MRSVCVGAMTFGFVLGAAGLASSQQASEAVVVTRGEGIVRAAPDRAFVIVRSEARAASPQEAQRLNAETMTAVRERLTEFDLDADAIRTLGVNLQPEFDFQDGRRTLRGYLASNSIELRLDDLPRLGTLIDAAVGSRATSLGGIRFDVRDRRTLERQALRDAVADARARADAAAAGAGAGGTIGRVIRIEEQGAAPSVQPPFRMAMQADAGQVATTPIAPGRIEVRVSVTLTASLR